MRPYKPTKPSNRKGTNNWQFTRRIDKVLHTKIAGHELKLLLPKQGYDEALSVNTKLRGTLSFSLGTTDFRVATNRCRKIDHELFNLLDTIRDGRIIYSKEEIYQFAEEVYAFYKNKYIDSTGLPNHEKTIASFVSTPFDELKAKVFPILQRNYKERKYYEIYEDTHLTGWSPHDDSDEAQEWRVGSLINWWMADIGNRLPQEDRWRLVLRVDQLIRAVVLYGQPDRKQGEPADQENPDPTRPVSFETILKSWEKTTKQTRYYSVKSRRTALRSIEAHVGHSNANAVTEQDMLSWREMMIANTYGTKTINHAYIPGLKTVFKHAYKAKLLDRNVSHVLESVKDESFEAKQGYPNAEIIKIASAAMACSDEAVRWIILLAIATGSRIGEVSQLGADQINPEFIDGLPSNSIWIRFRPSSFGGKLKNKVSARDVPITPILIHDSFLDFVNRRQGKPLFYNVNPRRTAESAEHEAVTKRTGKFIRQIREINPKIDTHHGFRHWVLTHANEVEIDVDTAEAFIGHARFGQRNTYNKIPVPTLLKKMAPLFQIFGEVAAQS